jgi:O-antigen ligase
MNKTQLPRRAKARSASTTMSIGMFVACLWGLHAAVVQLPRQGYFLVPVVAVVLCAFIMWRLISGTDRFDFGPKCGIAVGLACWFTAATLSTILNRQTDQVGLTYLVVFITGALLFVALSGVVMTPRDLDTATVGVAIGTLFPVVSGLLAFVGEWGTNVATAATAYRNVARMASYEAVTFGNRGNTAAFLLIVAPLLLTYVLDREKRGWLRVLCAAVVTLIAITLFVLQVRAAFVSMLLILMLVWIFKSGYRRLPVLFVAGTAAVLLFVNLAPEAGATMGEQLLAAVTVDTVGDASVQQRADAIREGIQIASRNWLLGIGPGGALTVHSHDSAHQFQVQQAMETGILGLFGSTLFSIGIWAALIRTMRRPRDAGNDVRFALLIGPAAYVAYSFMANATLGFGSLNSWTVLIASMLALVPSFPRARMTVGVVRASRLTPPAATRRVRPLAVPVRSTPSDAMRFSS